MSGAESEKPSFFGSRERACFYGRREMYQSIAAEAMLYEDTYISIHQSGSGGGQCETEQLRVRASSVQTTSARLGTFSSMSQHATNIGPKVLCHIEFVPTNLWYEKIV